MNTYTPDSWEFIRITTKEGVHGRVAAGWYGSYLGGASWKISSGNLACEEHEDRFVLPQESGSVYICFKKSRGMAAYTASVLAEYRKQPGIEIDVEATPTLPTA
jgi:hypothetical protein